MCPLVHVNNRLGSSQQLAIAGPRVSTRVRISLNGRRWDNELPYKCPQLLLVCGNIASNLYFQAADHWDGILEGIPPRLESPGVWLLGGHDGVRVVVTILKKRSVRVN
jgi:hypothetical protein